MDISKELKQDLDKKTKKLLRSFKREFLKIKNRKEFADTRLVEFINAKKSKTEPFYFGEKEVEPEFYKPEEMREFASVIYKKDKIILYIHYKGIYQGGFFHTTPKIFLKSFSFYEKVFKQIAHHEYGHSFLTKTEFDGHPEEVRGFLQNVNCEDIDEIQDDKIGELKKVLRESKYGIVEKGLNNIELYLVEKSLREIHADYSVLTRIESRVPIEILELKLYEFKEGLKEVEKWKELYFSSGEFGITQLSTYFFFLLILTQKFYIFDKWNLLKEVFQEYELDKILSLLRILNIILKKIIEKNDCIDKIRIDLFHLAKVLNEMDYETIFFKNNVIDKDLSQLKDFISKIK